MGEFLCLLLNNIIYFGRSKGDSLVFDFSRILPDIQSCLRRSPSCLFSLLLLFVFGFVLVLGPDLEAVCGIRILGLKGFKVHGQDRDELAGCRVRPWQSGACAARSPEQWSPDDYCWSLLWAELTDLWSPWVCEISQFRNVDHPFKLKMKQNQNSQHPTGQRKHVTLETQLPQGREHL